MTSSIPQATRQSTGTGGTTGTLQLTSYGAVADAVKLTDGAINPASSTLTSASAAFSAADIGKAIAVEACGVGNTGYAKITSGSATLTQTWITIKITASGGTWTYTHTGLGSVSGIAWNVTASALRTSLESLYGAGKVTVTLTGTTYTINLLSGAASTDTTQIVTVATSLTNTTGGAAPAALVTYQLWNYSDVGRRIHIPGAGISGGVLAAWIGSVETTTSNIAYLVDATGAPSTAATTLGGGAYYTLNWLRTTIQTVNSATSISLATTANSSVQTALSSVEVHYGTDNAAALTNAITAARAAQKPLDLGAGAYLSTAGVTSTSSNGFTMYGVSRDATEIRCIPTDAEAESARLLIAGTSDTSRVEGVSLRGFTWSVPTAHTRGSGSLAGYPNNKTNAGGILLAKINYFSIADVATNNNYGVAFNLQNCSHGLVSYCRAHNSWADSFNVNDANGGGVGVSDVTILGCEAYNSGDDMFTTNHYVANGPRPQRIAFIGCRGYQTRQLALGRGVAITGGDDITVTGCNMMNTNGSGFDVAAGRPANTINTVTVTTPGTGALATFAAAPANMTAGVTQVRLFKNDGSGATWIGNVASVSGGTAVTLTAATGQAATCPFTGANSLAQWGANTDGFRFSIGGSRHVVFTNCISEGSNINPAGDGTLNGALRINGGAASTESVIDVQVNSLNASTCYQSGVLVNSQWTSTSSDLASASATISDIVLSDVSISGTGFSNLTSTRPWCGVYVRIGQNVTVNLAKIRDTADEAILLASTGIGGRIRFQNIEASDIGRDPTSGVPLTAAINLSTSTSYTAHLEQLFLTNPAGTSGATQYVSSAVLSQPPTGSTIRGVNSDITGQTLLTESASRYSVTVSPMLYRGKGTPEGVVTAPPGALYEDSNSGGIYNKASGTSNTGWLLMGAGAGSFFPAVPMIANRWYSPGGSTTTLAMTANKLYAIPFDFTTALPTSALGLEITGVGSTGSVIRLGVWSDSSGSPGTAIRDFGTIDGTILYSTTPGNVAGTATPGIGRCYLVCAAQGTAATPPTVRSCNSSIFGVQSAAGGQPSGGLTGYFETGTASTGAFSGAFPAFSQSASVPRVCVKT